MSEEVPAGSGVASPVPPTTAVATGSLPLEALHDVELKVEVVLGRARLSLRELLGAHPGTTIELDRSVRSAADVMVNGTLFARAEVVVVDDTEMGVRITEVVGLELPAEGRD